MKLNIELIVPDNIHALEVQALLQEFHWLARLRGFRALLTLPRKMVYHRPNETDRAPGNR